MMKTCYYAVEEQTTYAVEEQTFIWLLNGCMWNASHSLEFQKTNLTAVTGSNAGGWIIPGKPQFFVITVYKQNNVNCNYFPPAKVYAFGTQLIDSFVKHIPNWTSTFSTYTSSTIVF